MEFYRCENCGNIYEQGEERVTEEYRGECFGFPSYEEVYGCPACGSPDYETLYPCGVCGELHPEDELFGGACGECIDKCRYDTETCERIAETEKVSVDVSPLITAMFDDMEIEAIVLDYLKRHSEGSIDYMPFIEQDKDWFGERLIEETNNAKKSKRR